MQQGNRFSGFRQRTLELELRRSEWRRHGKLLGQRAASLRRHTDAHHTFQHAQCVAGGGPNNLPALASPLYYPDDVVGDSKGTYSSRTATTLPSAELTRKHR